MVLDKRKIWLSIYIFLAIFQPPILPVTFIYIFGLITIFLLIYEKQILGGVTDKNSICAKSSLASTYKSFLLIGTYLLVISCADMLFIDANSIIVNRIQCINQLLVLTGIELLAVWYILKKAKDYKFDFYDILGLVITAGLLQGICACLAYFIPFVRSAFTKFGGTIYENEYVWARRGYGFSMTLLDTFGYGMGIIVGCALMTLKKKKLRNFIIIILCLFAIIVNARTGIVISAIAVILFILMGGNKRHLILYYIISAIVVICLVIYGAPALISICKKSNNITLSWVASSMQELYDVLFSSNSSLTSASFLSNFKVFPNNDFELIFGSGHSVYGIEDIIGFHSDVGYINMLWTYGVVGGIIITAVIISLYVKAYRSARDKTQKNLVIFLCISYFIVQLKAILIGYNPGVMVTYIILFSLIYFGNSKEIKNKETKELRVLRANQV